MAVTKFYLYPVRKDFDFRSQGFDTVQDAGAAAQDLLLNGNFETGSKIAIVQILAAVQLDNPSTKLTLANNL